MNPPVAAKSPPVAARSPSPLQKERDVTLLELLDRVLEKGVIVSGDVTISVADVDLIFLGLKVLLCSVETAERLRRADGLSPIADGLSQIADAVEDPR